MLYFQLCLKTFPPFSMTIPRCRQGGAREKVTQVSLRRKVMLCYDTNRFLNSCMFFEILRSQNANFKEKNGNKRHPLPYLGLVLIFMMKSALNNFIKSCAILILILLLLLLWLLSVLCLFIYLFIHLFIIYYTR